jgi:hypothetical protein
MVFSWMTVCLSLTVTMPLYGRVLYLRPWRPFIVKHSDENKCYIVICRRGCPWTIHARIGKDGCWRITSVVKPHTCSSNVDDRKHAQLSSRLISQTCQHH